LPEWLDGPRRLGQRRSPAADRRAPRTAADERDRQGAGRGPGARRRRQRLQRTLGPGAFGENLTVEGLDVSGARIGERWRIGDVELEVCQPRLPCAKLGLRFGDPRMVRRFAEAGRPGAYLRIVAEADVGAGDELTVSARPDHDVTVALVSRAILLDEELLARAADAPALPVALSQWMLERAA
jgi:MOSC domain-containing protein YiiM